MPKRITAKTRRDIIPEWWKLRRRFRRDDRIVRTCDEENRKSCYKKDAGPAGASRDGGGTGSGRSGDRRFLEQ